MLTRPATIKDFAVRYCDLSVSLGQLVMEIARGPAATHDLDLST